MEDLSLTLASMMAPRSWEKVGTEDHTKTWPGCTALHTTSMYSFQARRTKMWAQGEPQLLGRPAVQESSLVHHVSMRMNVHDTSSEPQYPTSAIIWSTNTYFVRSIWTCREMPDTPVGLTVVRSFYCRPPRRSYRFNQSCPRARTRLSVIASWLLVPAACVCMSPLVLGSTSLSSKWAVDMGHMDKEAWFVPISRQEETLSILRISMYIVAAVSSDNTLCGYPICSDRSYAPHCTVKPRRARR
jgi:hypothetical protein